MLLYISLHMWRIASLLKNFPKLNYTKFALWGQCLFWVPNIYFFCFTICLKTYSSFSSLWKSRNRRERLQPVEFTANKFISEKNLNKVVTLLPQSATRFEARIEMLSIFLKWIRSFKSLLSISQFTTSIL
jgi:hypothetical protein